MKRLRFHIAVFIIALASVATLVSLPTRPGLGQSREDSKMTAAATGASIKPAAVSEPPANSDAPSAAPSSTLFAAAAARNELLRDQLGWTFGGKQQRGWHIYVPLIGRLVESEHDAATGDFASALSRWQERAGLRPTGVLDEETLYAMVSTWQGARLKERGYPSPDRLLTAPTSDFYDPTRPDELRQVERETYAAYKRMVAAAAQDPALKLELTAAGELAPDEKFLKIISSFRSREYQAKLRAQSPHSGRAGLAVNHSPHFTGRALDLYVGGEPVETKDSNRALQVRTPVYRWLVRNADRFGFRPYYYEPWHWEYVGETK